MVKYRAIYALLPFCATALFASAFVAGRPQADGAPADTAESGQVTATIVKTIDAKKNKVGDPVTLKSNVETTLGNGIIILPALYSKAISIPSALRRIRETRHQLSLSTSSQSRMVKKFRSRPRLPAS
jgi:hypothetical protein